jgi:hypothetical protein
MSGSFSSDTSRMSVTSSDGVTSLCNTKKFSLPVIPLSVFIDRRSSDKYSCKCQIPLSFPEKINGSFRYRISYNLLHKQIYKTMCEELKKTREICSTKIDRLACIFWSIFCDSYIYNSNLEEIEVTVGNLEDSILSQSHHNEGKCPLLLDYWCCTPCTNSFLNIIIKSKKEISNVDFHTNIIPCDNETYKFISGRETILSSNPCLLSPNSPVVLCQGGKMTKTPLSHIKKYYSDIECYFLSPPLFHSRHFIVKVWGDNYIDDPFFRFIKEGRGVYENGFSTGQDSSYWREYICLDKSKIDSVKKNKKIWISIYRLKYTPPSKLILDYSERCDKIVEEMFRWFISCIGLQLPSHLDFREPLTISEIVSLEQNTRQSFCKDILQCYTDEGIVNENNIINEIEIVKPVSSPEFVIEIDEIKKAVRIEVDRPTVDSTGTSYRVYIFFNDKTVEEQKLSRGQIISQYRNLLDYSTQVAFFI